MERPGVAPGSLVCDTSIFLLDDRPLGDRRDSNSFLQGHDLPCVPLHHGHSASGWNRTNTSGSSDQRFHQVSFRRPLYEIRGDRGENTEPTVRIELTSTSLRGRVPAIGLSALLRRESNPRRSE